MGLVLLGLLLVPGLRAADDASTPPEGWTEYSPKDTSWTVWLPENQGAKSEHQRTVVAGKIQMRFSTAVVEARGGPTYEAATIFFPSQTELIKLSILQRIEMIRDIYAEALKGKVSEQSKITQGRVQGREYLIDGARDAARLRVYAFGGRIYVASVTGTRDQATSTDATTFLDSYKLPEKVTTPPKDH